MARLGHVTSRRSRVAALMTGGLLACSPVATMAQQAGVTAALRPISTDVAVEYATIGAVQLSIPVLRPDGGSAPPFGQSAANAQAGTGNITDISQGGQNNRAAVRAVGNDNTGLISQQGAGNSGQATLVGNGLRIDLQQIGNGNQADLNVSGASGGSLTLRQVGDGSNATLSAAGGRDITVNQIGNGLSAAMSQVGVPNGLSVVQVRTR